MEQNKNQLIRQIMNPIKDQELPQEKGQNQGSNLEHGHGQSHDQSKNQGADQSPDLNVAADQMQQSVSNVSNHQAPLNGVENTDNLQKGNAISSSINGHNLFDNQNDNKVYLRETGRGAAMDADPHPGSNVKPEVKKRRQLLMVLPLHILPFATLAFWALGGGQGAALAEGGVSNKAVTGINANIPSANFGEGAYDKMTVYRQAEILAESRQRAREQDGFSDADDSLGGNVIVQSGSGSVDSVYAGRQIDVQGNMEGLESEEDSNALKVTRKLAALQKIIENSGRTASGKQGSADSRIDPSIYGIQPGEVVGDRVRKVERDGAGTSEGERLFVGEELEVDNPKVAQTANRLHQLDQLKEMIAASSSGIDGADSDEISQINAMLDKVLAIQQGYNEKEVQGAVKGVAADEIESGRSGKIYHLSPIKPAIGVPLLAAGKPDILAGQSRVIYDSVEGGSIGVQVDSARVPGIGAEPMEVAGSAPIPGGEPEELQLKAVDRPNEEVSSLAGGISNNDNINHVTDREPIAIQGAFYDIDGNDGTADNADNTEGDRYPVGDGGPEQRGQSSNSSTNNDGIDNGRQLTALTIPASVAASQTLVSGGTVKLRLEEEIQLDGIVVPEGSFVFGSCRVSGERLQVAINHIRYKKQLLPVNLKVFDLDGLEGIHIPGSINRDAAKQGVDRGLSGMQLMSMDASVAAQAASAGVEAAKGLFSKKVRLIRVTVKAGYPLLLVDGKRASS